MAETTLKPPVLFWVLGIAFLLWNLMGCGIYLMEATVSDAAFEKANTAERIAARNFYPTWATAAYALAVWGGLLASILFLLRKRLSATLFIASLIFAVICFIPTFTSEIMRDAGGSTFWVMPMIVVGLGLVEIIYARKQLARGILR